MKRLLYLVAGAFNCIASAQSFTVRNANEEYVVSGIYENDISKKNLHEIEQDKNGLYWFQSFTELYSFDGINWKSYKCRPVNGKSTHPRINDIDILDDGSIILATENGIYIFDPGSEIFIPLKEKFPAIEGLPLAASCFYQGLAGNLLFTSAIKEGFFLLEWKTKKLQHIIIDSANRVLIPYGERIPVTSDVNGNVWGLTSNKIGVWNYDHTTGKVRCSWKGELPEFGDKRFQNVAGLTYSVNENALWISHGMNGYLEKMYLPTGKSSFYSFSGDLEVHADSNAVNKYPVFYVKKDMEDNEWIKVGKKYLVKLNKEISSMEYLVNDDILSLGDWRFFKPACGMNSNTGNDNTVLLWIDGTEKFSMIKKRRSFVRHIPFDTLSAPGIKAESYMNIDTRQTIFFEKGRDGKYFILQQNEGRPKLICLGNNLQIEKVLFNNEWKNYPAFFSQDFHPDTFYIAFMRKGIEPLDFRNFVLKDYKVDLRTFAIQEMKLIFKERVWRYGCADANNKYWLFSNGLLYSYDPKGDILDSIFISEPAAKESYPLELVKGYDYPTVLHKGTSTFWIDFIPKRELYKINLKTRKVENIFKCCISQQGCDIPGGVFDMYTLDETRIYLQQSFSSLLINAKSNSLTDYPQLFQHELSIQQQNGAGLYKDWLCVVLPTHIYFLNTVSGKQKELIFNEDFKWQISQFNSRPLVNDRGEMILMSSVNRGFLVFNIDSVPDPATPKAVYLSFIKLDNRNLILDSVIKRKGLTLKYNKYNSIQIGFSSYSFFDPRKITYDYTLYKGGDTVWNTIEGKPELTLSELSSGEYQLLVRAGNGFGDYSKQVTAFSIVVIPPFWQTWWFRILIMTVIGFVFYGIYRYRLQQLNRLQKIRNNIASDLHDDIGSTLNSISIYSEVAKQQAGKEIPALDLIGINSRKIIESMSDIVWTINPENDSFEKIIVRMRSFAYQLLKAKKVEYTFEADEKLNSIALPMQVRKNFYLVFKEAITNLIKYSGATRVSILLTEENKAIVLQIRDNGRGIPINAETQGNGLMNMKRRAEEINANLNIRSADGEGTGIELLLRT